MSSAWSNFVGGELVNVIANLQGAALAQLIRSAHGGLLAARASLVRADSNGSWSVSIRLDRVGSYVITRSGRERAHRLGDGQGPSARGADQLDQPAGNDGSYLGIILVGSAILIAGIALLTFTRIRNVGGRATSEADTTRVVSASLPSVARTARCEPPTAHHHGRYGGMGSMR